ncbi:MAG: hypothetical protein NPIRA06_15840 [Nitrospirales bacterium]|nr:MAG: hypothetical protein NPIRA06_15840 [Nitrospirales bacterium]
MFGLHQRVNKFREQQPLNVLKKRQEVNDTMTISRSRKEGMFLLRKGDYVWRVHEDGKVDCARPGDATALERLSFIQR